MKRSIIVVALLAVSTNVFGLGHKPNPPVNQLPEIYGDWTFTWQNWTNALPSPQKTTSRATEYWDGITVSMVMDVPHSAHATVAAKSADGLTTCNYYGPGALLMPEEVRSRWVCVLKDGLNQELATFIFIRKDNNAYGIAYISTENGDSVKVPLIGNRLNWGMWGYVQ